MPFFVYILRMNNGRLYVGHSNNPIRRHTEHEHGKGCRTTGIFGAGDIVHVEEHPDRTSASARERQIKGWTHSKIPDPRIGTARVSKLFNVLYSSVLRQFPAYLC